MDSGERLLMVKIIIICLDLIERRDDDRELSTLLN